jgi:hypothetical protein
MRELRKIGIFELHTIFFYISHHSRARESRSIHISKENITENYDYKLTTTFKGTFTFLVEIAVVSDGKIN